MARGPVAHIVDSNGNTGRLKVRKCREHEVAGRGAWVEGVFVFHRRYVEEPRLRQSPGWVVTCKVGAYGGGDTGMSLLPYPQKSGVSGGFAASYPALAKRGAGL